MATIAEQLAEAEAAYHALITGKAPRVVVDQNGERIEFVAANSTKLYLYIQSLRAQLEPVPVTPANTPVGFLF